jgi:lipoprotein-releasing system ATP-binding protein
MAELLRAQGLRKTFVVGAERLEVLKGIDLAVGRGEFVAVVGPSGAGKSTLLHLLGALERPSAGVVAYGGLLLGDLSEEALARFRNRTVGFVFQFHHLLPEFTALENVMLPLLIGRRGASEARGRAESLLHAVGLGDRLRHTPTELSGGEQQRVAMARALAAEPAILLADEPTGNLDSKTGEGVFDLLRQLNRERELTVVMVTHNESLSRRADRVVRMEDGRLASPHPPAGAPVDGGAGATAGPPAA